MIVKIKSALCVKEYEAHELSCFKTSQLSDVLDYLIQSRGFLSTLHKKLIDHNIKSIHGAIALRKKYSGFFAINRHFLTLRIN